MNLEMQEQDNTGTMMEIDKTESNLDEPSAAMNDHSGHGQSAVDDKDI